MRNKKQMRNTMKEYIAYAVFWGVMLIAIYGWTMVIALKG